MQKPNHAPQNHAPQIIRLLRGEVIKTRSTPFRLFNNSARESYICSRAASLALRR